MIGMVRNTILNYIYINFIGFHGNMPIEAVMHNFPLAAFEDVDFVGANYQQNNQSDYDSG